MVVIVMLIVMLPHEGKHSLSALTAATCRRRPLVKALPSQVVGNLDVGAADHRLEKSSRG